MAYKTINVAPATYERLKAYKAAGKSFDEVLNALLDRLEPEEFSAEVLREHQRRLERMKAGESISLDKLGDALRERHPRKPARRMARRARKGLR